MSAMRPIIQKILSVLCLVKACYCANDLLVSLPKIVVYKCCSDQQLLDDQFMCLNVNKTKTSLWSPLFYDDSRQLYSQVNEFELQFGLPNCGNHQARHVYDYKNSSDRLFLRSNGVLRHYTHYKTEEEDIDHNHDYALPTHDPNYYDHSSGTFCLDKALLAGGAEAQVAVVCVPAVVAIWDANMLIRRVVDPLLHALAICCLLIVSVVYFVLPPLRDLVGNIISTIAVCLIISQVADLVRIFTELSSHVSFMVADVVMYLSLLAGFFWLNSLGYYIWRSFRSRNVFLRVSDGRKYCYYSSFTWGFTFLMTLTALAAHFLFDEGNGLPFSPHDQETIGWLGIAVFFTPIACTILVDIFFYVTTARVIGRMATYGRIQSRMKFSFKLFLQLFLVMTTAWIFLLLSWLQYEALVFIHIIVNALQAPLILFICVLGRQSVRSMLRKGCCQADVEPQWGEEMMSMTST